MSEMNPQVSESTAVDSSPGFEARVWRKIGRIKKRRRTMAAVSGMVAVTVLMIGLVRSHPASSNQITKTASPLIKEEVPLTEHLIFAGSQDNVQYSLESVQYGSQLNRRRREI